MWFSVTFEAKGSYSSVTKTVSVTGDDAKSAIQRACDIWPLPDLREGGGDDAVAVTIKARKSDRPENVGRVTRIIDARTSGLKR